MDTRTHFEKKPYVNDWNLFHNTDVFAAIYGAGFRGLAEVTSLHKGVSYAIPATLTAIQFAYHGFKRIERGAYYDMDPFSNQTFHSHRRFHLFTQCSANSVATAGAIVATGFFASSGAFPAIASGVVAGSAASATWRTLLNVINATYTFCQKGCASEPEGYASIASQDAFANRNLSNANPHLNLFPNVNVSAGVSSAFGCALIAKYLPDLLGSYHCPIIAGTAAVLHMASLFVSYRNAQTPEGAVRFFSNSEFLKGFITTPATAFMSCHFTASFAAAGFFPAVASGIAIGVGTAAAVRLVTTCASSLFSSAQRNWEVRKLEAAARASRAEGADAGAVPLVGRPGLNRDTV